MLIINLTNKLFINLNIYIFVENKLILFMLQTLFLLVDKWKVKNKDMETYNLIFNQKYNILPIVDCKQNQKDGQITN